MTRFKVASDLQFKRQPILKILPYLLPNAETKEPLSLILAGDIANPFFQYNGDKREYEHGKTILPEFLKTIRPYYQHILYVPGNHEYYNLRMDHKIPMITFETELQRICTEHDVTLLNNKEITLDDTTHIVGSTLWSLCNKYAAIMINDYRCIYTFDTDKVDNPRLVTRHDTNKIHLDSVNYLTSKITPQSLIITHHTPLFNTQKTPNIQTHIWEVKLKLHFLLIYPILLEFQKYGFMGILIMLENFSLVILDS